jgi:uncharacterized protein (DUF1330 family)
MEVLNEMMPSTDEQRAEFAQPGPDGPIVMINLLKFKDRAEYPDGSDAELSGRDAYARYAAEVGPMAKRYGGRILFAGDVTFLAIGQAGELWDEVLLLEYPNRGALMAMSTSKEWRAISHHRKAGLAGQLNVEATHIDGVTTICEPAR